MNYGKTLTKIILINDSVNQFYDRDIFL